MKQIIKKFAPHSLWTRFRKISILRDQKRVSKLCDTYIDSYFTSNEGHYSLVPKKDLAGKKIIWQYWAQGFDCSNIPPLVKICLSSVEKFKGDYQIIRICDATISEYVDLPAFIYERKKTYSTTSFSNVLRLALLYLYGGCWLDTTVLLTAPLDNKYASMNFFMFQRDNHEVEKKYWEGTYSYYFGWDKSFKVRVLTSIAFSKPNSSFTRDYLYLLMLVWEKNPVYPFYFTFQVLFNQIIESGKSNPECPIISDCPPHCLMQLINDKSAPLSLVDELKECNIHKLSYKNCDMDSFYLVVNKYFPDVVQ